MVVLPAFATGFRGTPRSHAPAEVEKGRVGRGLSRRSAGRRRRIAWMEPSSIGLGRCPPAQVMGLLHRLRKVRGIVRLLEAQKRRCPHSR